MFLLQVSIFFAVAFVFIKAIGWLPLTVNSTTTQKTAFQVTGTGKVSTPPDAAVVTVGVTAQGNTVTAAQEELNSNINSVVEAVKGLGIPAEDIKTQNYNINPIYDFSNGGQTITGYTASSSVAIQVKDTTKVNQVVDTATTNGANQVGGVSFEVSDPTAAQNQARELAVEDAKLKAEQAANAAGFTLGRIIDYQESTNTGGQPVPFAAEASARDLSAPTEIQPGTSDIELNVTLSYELL